MKARALLLAALLSAACDAAAPGAEPGAAAVAQAGTVVDSIFPMPVMIERFQRAAGPRMDELPASSPTSRDSLVQRLVRAVEDSSATALQALRLDMRGYAWLYAPASPHLQEPYRQPPALGWMLVEQNGEKGATRLLRTFGGRGLGFTGYACGDATRMGVNTVWQDCVVAIRGRAEPMRLFGSIMERHGRFAFVSLANDL